MRFSVLSEYSALITSTCTHLDTLKECPEPLCYGEHAIPPLIQPHTLRKLQLVPNPLLSEKVNPVEVPSIRLHRVPNPIRDWEAKAALLCLWGERFSKVHLRHLTAEDCLVQSARKLESLHDNIRAATGAGRVVKHLRVWVAARVGCGARGLRPSNTHGSGLQVSVAGWTVGARSVQR